LSSHHVHMVGGKLWKTIVIIIIIPYWLFSYYATYR